MGLKSDQKKALMRSMSESLFKKEKITTTLAKAKELSVFAEKLITKGKQKNLASKRDLMKLFSQNIVKKITDEEYKRVVKRAQELGLTNLDIQGYGWLQG